MPRYKIYESIRAGDQMRVREVKRCRNLLEAFRIFEDLKIEPFPGVTQAVGIWSCRDREIIARKTG